MLYLVEPKQYMSQQYSRRDTLEITGIPENISKHQLVDEVPKCQLTDSIQKRLKMGKTTIAKMLNCKFARAALANGKNLQNTTRYENARIYIIVFAQSFDT